MNIMPDNAKTIPLAEFVQVRQSGLRSINVEHDVARRAVAEGYTLTPQARSTLARMLNRLTEPGAPSRAWTLTGPYGSGKSYFSLFLMNLLCSQLPAHQQLTAQLERDDPLLSEQVAAYAQLGESKGFLPIPITGYRATLQECLLHGIGQGIAALLSNTAVFTWYENIRETMATAESRQVVAHLQMLSDIICSPELGYRGLLLILDEMGKPLERLANQPETGDIYLLQEIAEFADRSDHPVVFVGILHQGFERYAGHLDMTTQREWAKVQGRFADIAFQEPPHQQMALLARAIVRTEEPAGIEELIANYTDDALENEWKPALISKAEFSALCRQAYPLHPTTLVALPHLFRRLAQNERSLFSYLGSLEPFGFQEFLQTHQLCDVVRLHNLFDYLVANFQGRLYASMRGRLITETVERLQNVPDLPPLAVMLLKSIGLVNWLAEVSDLQPTKQTLMATLRSPTVTTADIQAALDQLVGRSLIVFRRFNRSYVIWQGSDVDLDERMQAAQHKLQGVFKLAQTVQQYLPPRPVVARRHSYRTGFLRSWEMRYVDTLNRETISDTTQKGFAGTVLLCLPITKADHDSLIEWSLEASWQDKPDFVIGVAQETARLAQLTQELRSLHWVRENTPELRDDPVARRELRARINAVEILIRTEIDQTLSAHRLSKGDACRWFYQAEEITHRFGRGLSHLLSAISDTLYKGSPILWNELLNRRVLSSQGAAARRNLIEAMWLHGTRPQLGITGYPPERSMYESLLLASRLHVEVESGRWAFQFIPDDDPLQLKDVWQAMADFIFAAPPQPRPVDKLFTLLSQPPYGLTDGVLPVLLCAFVLINQAEVTLYRDGSLLPEPGIADWEVLLRRPELFQIAGCRVTGPLTQVVARFARGLGTETAVMPIVRDLIRRYKTLPEHTLRTQRLSEPTLALRRVFDNARSPEQFLFQEMPMALDLPPLTEVNLTPTLIETFFERLNNAMTELADDLPQLQRWSRDYFLQTSNLSSGDTGWHQFLALAQEMAPHIANPNLGPLIRRAAEAADPYTALDSVLAFIAGRPLRSWSDMDSDRYTAQARFYGQLLQAERNGSAPTTLLSEAERRRSQEIMEEIQQHLQVHYDATEWPLLQMALQLLAQQYQGKLIDEPL